MEDSYERSKKILEDMRDKGNGNPIAGGFDNESTSFFDDITGRTEARDMMKQQMRNYMDQTEITRKELDTKRDQVQAEKRRVEEKQVRSLRRNYRAPGFLGGGESSQPDMTSKLGG